MITRQSMHTLHQQDTYQEEASVCADRCVWRFRRVAIGYDPTLTA